MKGGGMPKIALFYKTGVIRRIELGSLIVCPINECGYEKDCAGKKAARDNAFTCDLRDLILLFMKDAEKK